MSRSTSYKNNYKRVCGNFLNYLARLRLYVAVISQQENFITTIKN